MFRGIQSSSPWRLTRPVREDQTYAPTYAPVSLNSPTGVPFHHRATSPLFPPPLSGVAQMYYFCYHGSSLTLPSRCLTQLGDKALAISPHHPLNKQMSNSDDVFCTTLELQVPSQVVLRGCHLTIASGSVRADIIRLSFSRLHGSSLLQV